MVCSSNAAEQETPDDMSMRQKKESGSLLVVQVRTVPVTEQFALRRGGRVNPTESEVVCPSVLVMVTVYMCSPGGSRVMSREDTPVVSRI